MTTPQALSISKNNKDTKREQWCYTTTKTTQLNYTWIIDDFSTKVSQLASPDLSTDAQTRFDILLDTHDIDRSDDKGYYSIRFRLWKVNQYPIVMKTTVSIVDRNGEKARRISDEIQANNSSYEEPSKKIVTRCDLMTAKDELLPDDRLTLFCEISAIEPGPEVSGKTRCKKMSIPESDLVDNFKDLLVNKMHCDVEFIVGPDGQKIQAHKAILTARSSVFRATFENDMEESKNNQVVVSDFSPDIFNEMLKFIYTDRVENLDDMARDLLIIANYYDLERLKIMCEESLHRNITVENAAETLLLADLYNASNLKIYTQNFAKKYTKEFTRTTGFQTMKKEHSQLAMETLTMLANNPMICPVLSEMDHLLLNAKLSDVILIIGEEKLFAHKVILASQSPVFAESFEPPNTSNELTIKDIESVIMKEVLAYLYTGELKEDNGIEILLKVLAVAETYEILKLKTLCASKLEKKLALDTAVTILIGAADYNVPDLSKTTFDFIQENKAKILSSDNFELLCSEKPKLLFKILALDIKK